MTCWMFFQILGSLAEFEHALMSERTRDARARARGGTSASNGTPPSARHSPLLTSGSAARIGDN
jgi:DNA invertase Pin-like site-specific DNA recombinase